VENAVVNARARSAVFRVWAGDFGDGDVGDGDAFEGEVVGEERKGRK